LVNNIGQNIKHTEKLFGKSVLKKLKKKLKKMSSNSDFVEKHGQQFQARAAGRVYIGPVAGMHGDTVVKRITYHEIPFQSSISALKHMRSIGKKDPTADIMINARRLKMVSQHDD